MEIVLNNIVKSTANPSKNGTLGKHNGVITDIESTKLQRTARKPKSKSNQAPLNTKQLKPFKQYTKASTIIKKLHSTRGVTIEALVQLTGWQAHSVRGFLSGTVRKRLGLNLTSQPGKDGNRRYRIEEKVGK